MEVPQKSTNKTTLQAILLLGIYPEKNNNTNASNTCCLKFIAILFNSQDMEETQGPINR